MLIFPTAYSLVIWKYQTSKNDDLKFGYDTIDLFS